MAPIGIVQGIYAKYFGLSLTTIAAVILFVRIFDAVTDPLIGYYSDRYRRRKGTRKPFVLVGGLLMIISSYLLYVPIYVNVPYFVICFMLFYIAHTLFDIPHNAWASDLASTSTGKSKIYTFRSMAGYFGLSFFYLTPLLPFFETRDITPDTLKLSVILASSLMLPFLYICLKKTPSGYCAGHTGSGKIENSTFSEKIINTLSFFDKNIMGNKPVLIFFASYLFYGLSVGLWYALIFFYVDGYLDLGEKFAQVFLLAFMIGICVTPLWCKLAICWGKKQTVLLAVLIVIASFYYTGILEPGQTGLLQLILLKGINTLGASCLAAIMPAILSETIDYSTWKYRVEHAASYFALLSFSTKASAALGAALGLAVAGIHGFDATITTQSSESKRGLLLAISWMPITLGLFSLILISLNPINPRRHRVIRRRLDGLAERSRRLP